MKKAADDEKLYDIIQMVVINEQISLKMKLNGLSLTSRRRLVPF